MQRKENEQQPIGNLRRKEKLSSELITLGMVIN
jgi:hypothetical protein